MKGDRPAQKTMAELVQNIEARRNADHLSFRERD